MSFSINTNIASLQAQNYLRVNSNFQSKTINEVTSGLRIVNSGDDAAGLAVANGFRSDEAVLTQGIQNANDGLATLQTIDGGMSNISQLLDRARTLATESASGTFEGDRSQLDSEFQSVLTEINRQAQSIGMNSTGNFAKNLQVFIGGGRDSTGNSSDAGAVAEGSVNIDLSKAAVDTQSLGLSTYATATPTTLPTLSTITNSANLNGNNLTLNFSGAGFSSGVNGPVTVTAIGVNGATSLQDVVNDINNGIATAEAQSGAANAAFSKLGIQAELNSAGTGVVFTSANGGFSVADTGDASATAAEDLLGTSTSLTPVIAGGTYQVALNETAILGAGLTQDLTFSATDANGTLTQVTAHLTHADTKALDIQAINTALQGAAAGSPLKGLTAYNSDAGVTGGVVISGASNFQVFLGATAAGTGLEATSGTASGVFVGASQPTGGGQLDVKTASDAQTAVTALANAVNALGTAQASVGKGENNFNYAINLANSQLTNETSAESSIRDADLATEAANLTKAQILMQAGVAALAQANAAPQNILTLLKG